MNNESLQQQIKELEEALREANDENIELRGALSKQNIEPFTAVSFSVVTVIYESLHGMTMIFPVPTNIVGKAKVATLLRQAADQVLGSMK